MAGCVCVRGPCKACASLKAQFRARAATLLAHLSCAAPLLNLLLPGCIIGFKLKGIYCLVKEGLGLSCGSPVHDFSAKRPTECVKALFIAQHN
jgi:hypothetical protein